jgi:excisionase family DNA binding protein
VQPVHVNEYKREKGRYNGPARKNKYGKTGNSATREKFMIELMQNNEAAPAANGPEGYITKKELALRLKKSERTIELWQRKGIIPYIKARQSVLFKWADVEQHLQAHFRICRHKAL